MIDQGLKNLGFAEAGVASVGRKKVDWPAPERRETVTRVVGDAGLGQGEPVLEVGGGEFAVVMRGDEPLGVLGEGRYIAEGGRAGGLGLVWLKATPWTFRCHVSEVWTADQRRIKAEIWIRVAIDAPSRFVSAVVGAEPLVGRKHLQVVLEPPAQRVIAEIVKRRDAGDLDKNREGFAEALSPEIAGAFAGMGLSVSKVEVVSLVVLTQRLGTSAGSSGPTGSTSPVPAASMATGAGSAPADALMRVSGERASSDPGVEVVEGVIEPAGPAVRGRTREVVRITETEVRWSFESGSAQESGSASGPADPEALMAMIQAEADRLADLAEAGQISPEEYHRQIEALEEEVSRLSQEG